jgi:hypothetical protein
MFWNVERHPIPLALGLGGIFLFGDWVSHLGNIATADFIFGQDGVFGADGWIGHRFHGPPDPAQLIAIAGGTAKDLDPITDDDNPTFVALQRLIVELKSGGLTADQLRAASHQIRLAEHLWKHRQLGHVIVKNWWGESVWIDLNKAIDVKPGVDLSKLPLDSSYKLRVFFEHMQGHGPRLEVTEGSNLSVAHKTDDHGTKCVDIGFENMSKYTPENIARVLATDLDPSNPETYYETPSQAGFEQLRHDVMTKLMGDPYHMSKSAAYSFVYGNGNPESGHVRCISWATERHFHQDLLK